MTLLDSHGDQVTSKRFTDSRTFYVWDDINVRARHLRIDALKHEGGCGQYIGPYICLFEDIEKNRETI